MLRGRHHLAKKTYSPRNDAKGIPTEAEHLLAFSKRPGWLPNKLERTEEMDSKYKNPDNDTMPWRSDNPCASDAATHQGMVYAIQHPFTGELIYPYQGAHWRYEQNTMLSYMEGWCPYELRDLHDDGRRAEVCGVPVEQVRPEVKAIMLKEPLDVSREKAQAVYKRG
jgi:adenine-specific DNA-methyltransferase